MIRPQSIGHPIGHGRNIGLAWWPYDSYLLHRVGKMMPPSTTVGLSRICNPGPYLHTLVYICIKKGDTSGWNARILSV